MVKIKIFDKGFLIRVNEKQVRTPTEILCHARDADLIISQLNSLGIKNYSIVSKVPDGPKDLFKGGVPVSTPLMITPDGYKLNYIRDTPDERDHAPLMANTTILREANEAGIIDYTNSMSPVKDQGKLGSCVGFAVTAMKEWQEQQEHLLEVEEGKKDNRKKLSYDLSEQWLYYKCKEIDSWPNEEGTSIRYAMKVLSKVGVPCEKAWPYDDINVGEPARWATLVSRWALGGEYVRLDTPESIIVALKDNGPVPVGIGCYQEIFYAKSDGIVPYPKDPQTCYGGHAICLIGWNPETRMFKFKNSWGTSWGENGYGYLPYNYIKDFCWDAWMIKDLQVTREMLKNQAV
jgi:hypothetical protein